MIIIHGCLVTSGVLIYFNSAFARVVLILGKPHDAFPDILRKL